MSYDTTVNPSEVEYYERLADRWWDSTGPFWPLHKLNELRVEYLRSELCRHFNLTTQSATPLSGLKILDVGCGGGILSESMAHLGANVTGIDVVEKNIRAAAVHAQDKGLSVRYLESTAAAMAATGQQFDVVLNMEVVEHVADLPVFMEACNRLTRAGGVMFVSTINRTWRAWLFAIVGAEYILNWLPRGTHRWRDFRKPRQIRELLRNGRLAVQRTIGVRVNPLTRSFRLTPNLSVNYMLMATRDKA